MLLFRSILLLSACCLPAWTSSVLWSFRRFSDNSSLLPQLQPVQPPYQLYMLSREWPQTTCQLHRDHESHGCVIHSNVTDWSIHGLWPSNYTGPDPAYCGGPAFQLQQLQPIMAQLLQLWPNVFADQTAAQFWQHEWRRHGSCALAAGAVQSQLEFFVRTMQLHQAMSVRSVLALAHIEPGRAGVSVKRMADALAGALAVRFELQCRHDAALGVYLPAEIRVCFSNAWRPVDCYLDGGVQHTRYRLLDCRDDNVFYLPIEHSAE